MRFLVTAGPTREHVDPVRFLSNPSTGKMGFAVARAAAKAGHEAVLVAGPVALATPRGVRRVDVVSARDMLAAVMKELPSADVLVMTAAVADWRPAKTAARKLKKREMKPVLALVRNPDILRTVRKGLGAARGGKVIVGFAAETGEPTAEAVRKCREKGLDLVVANDVTAKGAGFGTDTNVASFVSPDGSVERLPLMTKNALASRIVRRAFALAQSRGKCGIAGRGR